MKKTTFILRSLLSTAIALAIPSMAVAGINTESSQQAANYRHTTVVNLATMTGVFNAAVQEYVNKTISVPWNVTNSTTAISYAPFLVYSGGNSASCAPPSGSGTTVSGTVALPSTYLPPNWAPPVSGTFCSVVWVDNPAPTEVTLQSYFVPGSKLVQNTLNSQTSMSAQYLTYHSANAIAQQYTQQAQTANPNWVALYSSASSGNWSTISKNGVAPASPSSMMSQSLTSMPSSSSTSSPIMTSIMQPSGTSSGTTGTSSSTTGSTSCINLTGSFAQYDTPSVPSTLTACE